MANFKGKIARGWRETRGNIAVELTKWAGGSTVVGAIFKAISQAAHRVPVDWWLFVCLLVVGGGLVVYSLYAKGGTQHNHGSSEPATQEESVDTADAVMLFHFEAQAKDLIRDLETAWHHWNNVGERLIHPVGQPNDVKTADTELLIKLLNESRDFKVRYGDHLKYLHLRLPRFTSDALRHGYPNNREYQHVLFDLKTHREALESAGRASLNSASVVVEPTMLANERRFSSLTSDALQLSIDLLRFLNKLGTEPAPKYTRDQLARLPGSETQRLIESNDGDYSEACAYHDGDHRIFDLTSDGLYRGIANRHTRMVPWYEKVRASYALEMRARVEEMRNRFSVEGLSDGDLLLPVENFDSTKNVRLIAAKIWELAFKLEEKQCQ
jgi:hypothetical protein